jgi:type II secretory pathway pseudopilin PulG
MKKFNFQNKGFSMIELLIYLGILVVVLTMIMQITVPIIKSNIVTKGQTQIRQEIAYLIEKLTSEAKNSLEVNLVSDWIIRFKKSNQESYIRFGQKTYINENNEVLGYMHSFYGGTFSLNCKNFNTSCLVNYGVVFNEQNQRLEGWAWSPILGWIHFATSSSYLEYNVRYNSSTREFYGYAWNDVIGWIKFNCDPSGNSQNCTSLKWKVALDEEKNIYGYAWNDVIGWIVFDGKNAYAFYRDQNNEVNLLSKNIYFKKVNFEKVNSSINGYLKAELISPLPGKPIEMETYVNILQGKLR